MEKKTFNPHDWLQEPTLPQNDAVPQIPDPSSTPEDVEKIILSLEAKQLDITSTYGDWINIGFAFADAFGEAGRNLFHRVSKFHPEYSTPDCNKQYDSCLKSKGSGVSLKSFFYMAKQAGIEIQAPKKKTNPSETTNRQIPKNHQKNPLPESEEVKEEMPTFPQSLFPELPEFLQSVVAIATSNEERDILLLGSIVAISACLPKVSGIYDGKRVFSNLFLFITAQASAGKGRLVHCRQLVTPIHKEFREQAKLKKQQYELEMIQFNASKGKADGLEKPEKPPEKMLFIPANNSSTGAYQLLGDSDGRGLIFETEGDTLAHAFKSDYGNYSDGFRKAFHHETISFYRRTEREFVDIESPCLSTVLSGTPRQVSALIPNAENGLFSRFIFYFMNVRPVWKNVFASQTNNGLDDYFENLGNRFYELYTQLNSGEQIQFYLTADQQDQFNHFFEQIQVKYLNLQGMDYMATIRRLGLIAFRISMIFSALRILETGDTSKKIICEERDFQASLDMVKVLVKHSSKVFRELPKEETTPPRLNKKEKFLYSLPKNFNRKSYLTVADTLGIPAKTAEGYITTFIKSNLIHRESQDSYINTSLEETKDVEETKDA